MVLDFWMFEVFHSLKAVVSVKHFDMSKYTTLTVKHCLMHTGVVGRTFESSRGNNYTIKGLFPIGHDREALALVEYVRSGRESYLNLERIAHDREVKTSSRN